jgi:hypothetical protein
LDPDLDPYWSPSSTSGSGSGSGKNEYGSETLARGLHYLLYAKASREIIAMGLVVLRKNVSERFSIINPLLNEEKPFQFESTNIVAKKLQPLL